jgi:hypothetical protein
MPDAVDRVRAAADDRDADAPEGDGRVVEERGLLGERILAVSVPDVRSPWARQ